MHNIHRYTYVYIYVNIDIHVICIYMGRWGISNSNVLVLGSSQAGTLLATGAEDGNMSVFGVHLRCHRCHGIHGTIGEKWGCSAPSCIRQNIIMEIPEIPV